MKSKIAIAEIAQPYAVALMSVAQSKNLVDQFGEDVRTLLSLLGQSEQLRNFVGNPFIQPEKKKAVINQILGEGSNSYLHNFFMLLVDRRRISLLEPILQEYLTLLRELKQTVLASVISAVPLSEAQQAAIKEKVIAMTNAHEVELDTQIDGDLIGGVIIKVGSQVIDASLRGQLRRLALSLTSA